jgi:hypothetical protein
MVVGVSACFISLPVDAGCIKDSKATSILNDLKQVGTKQNKVLDAIMASRNSWDKSPIVWVENYPYKIRVVELASSFVILLQMNVRIEYKNNGKEVYKVIGKRTVKIVFDR